MINALVPYVSLKWLLLDGKVSTDGFRQALGTFLPAPISLFPC